MPAARYWRIIGIDTLLSNDLQLLELAFFDVANTRLDLWATITSTLSPTSGALSSLNDNSNATSVNFANADVSSPGFEIRYDFGSPVDVNNITPTAVSVATAPISFNLEYQDANGAWLGLYSFTISYQGTPAVPETTADPFYNDVALYTWILGSPLQRQRRSVAQNNSSVAVEYFSTRFINGFFSPTKVNLGTTGGSLLAVTVDWGIAATYTDDFTLEVVARGVGSVGTTTPQIVIGFVGGYSIRFTLVATGSPPSTYYLFDPAGTQLASVVVANAWAHLAISRGSGVVRWFVDGVLIHSVSDSSPMTFTSIRSQATQGELSIDGIRLTERVARYTTAFTRPTVPFPSQSSLPLNSIGISTIAPISSGPATDTVVRFIAEPAIFPGDPVGTTSIEYRALPNLHELMYGGSKSISGNVKKQALPSDLPISRRVRLYYATRLIRETWSDPVTGDFVFTDVAKGGPYTVIAYDYENNYRALVTDKLFTD